MSPWLRELGLGALVVFMLGYAWLFSAVSVPNERTRLYLSLAIVEDGTLAIDGPMKRHGRVYDLAQHDGHYYTDKAPGSSFLAVPVVVAARALHGDHPLSIVALLNHVRTFLMLPMALLGYVLLRRLLAAFALSESTRDVVSLGYALGTPALHYGTAFYGHVLVATLLIVALFALTRAGSFGGTSGSRRGSWIALAGAAAGLLGLVEYQAIVLSALLALPIALDARADRIRALALFAVGALPFAVALLVYDTYAFGGPFELSYHHLASNELKDLHGFGLAGATHPTFASVSGLLWSRHRGLLTTSPLMGLGALGLFVARHHLPRALWLLTLLACAYFFLIVASSSVWFGGWSFGPRLLVPILPLLSLGAAFLLERAGPDARGVALRGLFAASALFGISYHLLLQVTFPELPPSTLAPLPDAVKVALDAGLVAPNLACKLTGLDVSNLWPMVFASAAVLLHVAVRPFESSWLRTGLRAAASLAIAGLALLLLWSEAPSTTPRERAKWAKLVAGWSAREQSCTGGSP